ncbi:hypothetical protein BDZ89DRAFT_1131258 [Hymenopellis radicata]|nr:hypothetical protein BDZ89DRAFT_1131258 [Hymenopellis radicata]
MPDIFAVTGSVTEVEVVTPVLKEHAAASPKSQVDDFEADVPNVDAGLTVPDGFAASTSAADTKVVSPVLKKRAAASPKFQMETLSQEGGSTQRRWLVTRGHEDWGWESGKFLSPSTHSEVSGCFDADPVMTGGPELSAARLGKGIHILDVFGHTIPGPDPLALLFLLLG